MRENRSVLLLITIIILIIVSYFTFFNDYLMYLDVKNYPTQMICKKYYREFPQGYFTEEVKLIEIEETRSIDLVRSFLYDYPESEQYELVEQIKNQLWDFELARYDSIVNTDPNFDSKAVIFFKEMLEFLRDSNQSEIGLILNGNTHLKNFSDYAPELVEWYDLSYLESDNRTVTGNIAELKQHYEQGNIEFYEEIISKSVESSFENILSSNFIHVLPLGSSNSGLNIEIEYHIMNQEDEYEGVLFPHLWVYSEGGRSEFESVFLSYIIGVEMYFQFSISIPNTDVKYEFATSTNALDNIQNITNIEEGYSEMTKQNFQNFANGISTRFGLSSNSVTIEY